MAKYYLSGPMSGIPRFNFPAFDKAAAELREMGMDIVSPSELDRPEVRKAALESEDGITLDRTACPETWGDFLSRDVKLIADECDGVIFLPGWTESRGAVLEGIVALMAGSVEFYYWNGHTLSYITADTFSEVAGHFLARKADANIDEIFGGEAVSDE